MAAPTLTPTTFSSGADDALAAVDVYSQKGLGIINNSKLNIGKSTGSLIDNVFDKPLAKSELKGMISVSKKGEIVVDRGAMMKGIVASNSTLSSAVATMKDEVKNNVVVSEMTSKIKATVDGVNSYVCRADLSTVTSLVRAVAGLRGLTNLPFSFKDISSTVSMGANLVKESARACLAGVFKQLSQEPTYQGEVMNKITGEITGTVLGTTNNNLLTEVVGAGYGSIMLRKQPAFIKKYLTNYSSRTTSLKTKQRELNASLPSDYAKMKNSFDLLDPSWNKTIRSGTNVLNTSTFNTASPMAKKTFAAGINASAPSAGSAVAQAKQTATLSSLNTASSVSTEAFTLLGLNMSAGSVSSAIAAELA